MALGSHVQESRFSSIFIDFLRFSSIFVDFRRPFSSMFNDFLRFSSISGMDLGRIWVDLGSGSEMNLGSGSDPVLARFARFRSDSSN